MKSIVAETKILSAEAGEHWREVYDGALQLLGACCTETLNDVEVLEANVAPYRSFYALHEFLFPLAGRIQLGYNYDECGEEGTFAVFAVHDDSDVPDLYINENVAAAMDQIKHAVKEALFTS